MLQIPNDDQRWSGTVQCNRCISLLTCMYDSAEHSCAIWTPPHDAKPLKMCQQEQNMSCRVVVFLFCYVINTMTPDLIFIDVYWHTRRRRFSFAKLALISVYNVAVLARIEGTLTHGWIASDEPCYSQNFRRWCEWQRESSCCFDLFV